MDDENSTQSCSFRVKQVAKGVFFTVMAICSFSYLSAQEFIPAQPYGGATELKEFIKLEMQYPEQDLKNKVEGEVKLLISTNVKGQVLSIKVAHSMTPAMDSEAVRIMRKVLWKPALNMGEAVPDSQVLAISFNIKKYNRYCSERDYTAIIYPHEPVDESNKIYSYNEVDDLPKPIFEDQSMTLGGFINKEIQYPDAARKFNIMGKETISFVVELSGIISNIQPEDYVGAGCWEESVRLVKLLTWYPGIKGEKAVRTTMTISITFNLSDESGLHYVPTQLNNIVQ